MTWRGKLRQQLEIGVALPRAALSRLFVRHPRGPRFSGAWQTRPAASAACGTAGYDDAGIADVSFDVMCARAVWDYPMIFWLKRLLQDHPTVIDAGGHMGTKYIAFSDLLDLRDVRWTVYDLPGIVMAACARQDTGGIPQTIGFEHALDALGPADILIGSGLLQYLDRPFAEFVGALDEKPKHILLNKIAIRNGPAIFTAERIGRNQVPYQVRNRDSWEAEISAMGYDIVDSWTIPELGHVITTHPWLGRSESRGYALRLQKAVSA